MARPVEGLTNHFILCGFGRVGRQIAADVHRRDHALVAIDRDAAALREAEGIATITGDAADDAVLAHAGIARARGLVAATGSDATNIVITLSARTLNDGLLILARANQPEAEAKLLRAGASRVVSPYVIGAHRMAAQLVSPGATAFLDALRNTGQLDLWLEEATVAAGSAFAGHAVGDVLPRATGHTNLIAVRPAGQSRFLTNPARDLRLGPGDVLIAVGSRQQLRELIARASAPPTP